MNKISFWTLPKVTYQNSKMMQPIIGMLKLTDLYHGMALIYPSAFAFRIPFAMSPEEFV